jgi:uncharacterized protein (TIGR02001 family)
MTPRTFLALAALCALLPAAAEADPFLSGVLAPQIMIASDYRYDGVSESAERPVIQGSLYWWRPDKTYAGIFLTQVDLRDPGKTSYEIDYYVGHHFNLKGTEITPEAMYTAFPDNRTWGPTYDFLQLKVKARRKTGKLTYGGELSWVPEASYRAGVNWRAAALGEYQLTDKIALTAKLGEVWTHRGPDRTFYEVGGKLSGKTAAFELRYMGTDLEPAQCGYLRNDWCSPALVGTLTLNLPYILVKPR